MTFTFGGMHVFRLLICVAIVLSLGIASARAQAPATTQSAGQKTVRLLSIGNSFSSDATDYLPGITAAGGHKFVFGHARIGGSPLERHAKAITAFETNPEDPAGQPYRVTLPGGGFANVSLKALLIEQPWEYVTIQQGSWLSHKPETYQPYADQIVAYVRQHAPQAKILIHETWAYRADEEIFTKDNFTPDEMYARLHKGYQGLAKSVGATMIIPVGTAFQNTREDSRWVEEIAKVNLADYVRPKLPPDDRSMYKSWLWTRRQGVTQIYPDCRHASKYGKFLGAAVWYETLFGEDVRQNTYVPRDMDPADARLLRDIAHKTVTEKLIPTAATMDFSPKEPLPVVPPTPAAPATAPALPVSAH